MTINEHSHLRIVGIGASAGGLEAFEIFFRNLPDSAGLSVIVVQHLAPDNRSILPEILQRYTELPVTQIQETTEIEANHVYVIPPNYDIGVKSNELHLFEPGAPRGFRLPVDFLFRSLAENFGSQAVGIVLSGTGSDGTLGIKAIKGAGGLTIVQNPDTTKFTGMPLSAIHTGLVDHIVDVDAMPNIVQHYFENNRFIDLETVQPEIAGVLQRILILIRDELGHDFSLYKPNTIVRRIERRMVINRIDDINDYLRYLRATPLEITNLFHDMLIGVTSFFRDKDAFIALKTQIIPRIMENKRDRDAVRVWVAGCSTGEEAISIAILLEEQKVEMELSEIDIQVFATDIDRLAIDKAREGIFPPNIVLDINPEYLQKYFVKDENGTYHLTKTIRRSLVFAEQNVVKDPPFSNLDLVSCRNLLIYMTPELQSMVLNIFHYALSNDRYLFLGGSETISVVEGLFSTVDQRHRLFQKINVQTPFQPSSRQYTGLAFDPRLKTKIDNKKRIRETIEATLLQAYAPPAVIVNESGEILYHQGDTSRFWVTGTGESSWNILRIARPELRAPLTMAIRNVIVNNKKVVLHNIRLKIDSELIELDLILRPTPLETNSERLVVVSFEQKIYKAEDALIDLPDDYDAIVSRRINELEDEVRLKNEYLDSTIQELEASNEELQSVNEEFQSSNEELRSTNEELETSREELQAINEELLTMNAELNSKIEALDKLNNDQRNILNNINIGLLILTGNLGIRVFNPVAGNIFNLIETDINRPVTQLSPNFQSDDLEEKVLSVINTLRPVTIEILVDETMYLMQIHPYRTPEGDVDGVVLTFTDISDRKAIETELRQNEQKLRSIFDVLPVGVSLLDNNRRIVEVNDALERIMQMSLSDLHAGKYAARRYINHEELPMEAYQFPSNRAIAEQKPIFNEEIGVIKEDGNIIWTSVSAAPLDVPDLSAVVVTADITQQKTSEAIIQENEKRLGDVLINSKTIVFEQDENLKYISLFNHNRAFKREQILGHYDTDLLNPEDAAQIIAVKRQVMETEQPVRFDFPADIEGQIFYYDMIIQPRYDSGGRVSGIVASATDITDRKQIEQELLFQSEVLANLAEGVYLIQTTSGKIVYANARFLEMFGYDEPELIGQHVGIVNAPDDGEPGETATRITQALHKEGIWSGEVHNIRKDGTTFWCHATVSTFEHPEYGEVWISIHQDITSRKEQEQALAYESERYHALQQLHPGSSVLLFDRHLTVTHIIGYELIDTLGYPAQNLLNQPLFDGMQGDIATELKPLCQATLQGETNHATHRIENSDDTLESLHFPLYDSNTPDKNITGMLLLRKVSSNRGDAERSV